MGTATATRGGVLRTPHQGAKVALKKRARPRSDGTEGEETIIDRGRDFDEVKAIVDEVNLTTPPATYKPMPEGYTIDDLLRETDGD